MQYRFGFIPSTSLANMIEEAYQVLTQQQSANQPLYAYRNCLIEKVADELVENTVTNQAHSLTNEQHKKQLLKLGLFLQSSIQKMVHLMLSKDKDTVVMQSAVFLQDSLAYDQQGNLRLGAAITQDLYQQIACTHEQVLQGNIDAAVIKQIQSCYKQFDNVVLQHFMVDFVKTLNWGMIKINLAKGTKVAMTSANHVLIDQMIPKIEHKELQEVLPTVGNLFFAAKDEKPYVF